VFYYISKLAIPDIKYVGIDYADNAVSIAKSAWNHNGFIQKDLFQLNSCDVKQFDLLYLGAVFDVLPNGDKALEHILSLTPNNIAIGRMRLTSDPSYFKEYIAYDELLTCKYFHNVNKFVYLCQKYQYTINSIGDTQLLIRQR
jgi:hypothetical protein